ncbi:MAG TPA: hypothetical protein VLB44_18315 [Kofleriaceae bacterium]|nr:hypothetical protein [Kofleriaceae bacterium]
MRYALFIVALVGCNADIDEPWQLDHDRIIVVRADPPSISAGETSKIDLLAGFAENPVAARAPDFVQVVTPMSLADLVAPDSGGWTVTAPSDDRIAAARAELAIPGGMPVPLRIGVAAAWPNPVMSPNDMGFGAIKIVWLGTSAQNPTMEGLTINGAEPPPDGDEIVVPKATKVPLFVEADDSRDIVTWLTSCGTMHDFDLHAAYLRVEPEDKQEGELAVIKRDDHGGVAWRVWKIRAE